MAKAPEKHVHKLRKHVHKSGTAVLFCALPDCHFKINPALALGKRSICWLCGEVFILSEYSLRLVKPHCEKCHKPKNKKGVITPIPLSIQDENKASLESGFKLTTSSLGEKLSLSERLKNLSKRMAESDAVGVVESDEDI